MRSNRIAVTAAVLALLVAAAAFAGDKAATPAATPTTSAAAPAPAAPAAPALEELAIGAKAPDFKLMNVDGKEYTLAQATTGKNGKPAKATAIVFTCNACPYSQAYEPVLQEMAKKYAEQNVAFVFINPNDAKIVPADSYEKMQERAKEKGYTFPYLYDESQAVAKAYGASRTPHVFLVDDQMVLRYRGRVNDSKDAAEVKSNDLTNAIDAIVSGKDVETAATKAFGCSIKWRKAS